MPNSLWVLVRRATRPSTPSRMRGDEHGDAGVLEMALGRGDDRVEAGEQAAGGEQVRQQVDAAAARPRGVRSSMFASLTLACAPTRCCNRASRRLASGAFHAQPHAPTAHRDCSSGSPPCSLALPALAGKVYQWKDAKGVTHYSDSPPPGKPQYQEPSARATVPRRLRPTPRPSRAEAPNCVTARKNLDQPQERRARWAWTPTATASRTRK